MQDFNGINSMKKKIIKKINPNFKLFLKYSETLFSFKLVIIEIIRGMNPIAKNVHQTKSVSTIGIDNCAI